MASVVPVEDLNVVAIGEVLWDLIGEERHLGGAPFNFAYHAHAFGATGSLISRVGRDDLGSLIRNRAEEIGLPRDYIQVDPVRPTGTVPVTLGAGGTASYEITPEVAWDYIEFYDGDRYLLDKADILCFGTLAQRSAISRTSIQAALASAPANCLRVCDINLRPPHYDEQVLRSTLELTDVLKLNEGELAAMRPKLGLPANEIDAVQDLIQKFDIATVVLTRGPMGAEAWSKGEHAASEGVKVEVKDTVGSGDAFTAAFVLHLATGHSLRDSLRKANLAGAYVATQAGGTPAISHDVLRRFEREGS
ncbi:MAG: carbohydrate kinase family protein [Candidatus Sumerlaeaceae bacterium]